MMLDGLELKGRMMIVALGITTEGVKVPLGLWGDRRRTRRSRPRCCRTWSRAAWILSKGCCSCSTAQRALRKAVRSVFGEVPVQRCIRHKERNILAHLPERDRPPIKARLRRAWADTDYDRALEQLQRLADELEHTHPGAAGSLREGMHETLTVIGLGVNGKLRKTLESTNPAESMIDCVRTTQRNVKHWSSGEMGCGGPPPGCSKPKSSSARSSATPSSHSSPSRSNADYTPTSPTRKRPRTPRSQSLCNDHTGTVLTEVPRRPGQPPMGSYVEL
jgi:putative transposase